MMKCILYLVAPAFLLTLSACTSYTPRDEDGLVNIIPTAEKDRGPSKRIDVSHVPDAVPKVEKRTKAGNKSPYKVMGVVYRVMESPDGYKEKGMASWYGVKFHGNSTSNGEKYDMYAMTAAHKTLPIPSYVRVTNLENGRSAIVRVNDRGPFEKGRIIDLSYAGAQKLGYVDAGTAKVKVEYIDPSTYTPSAKSRPSAPAPKTTSKSEGVGERFLQVGAFSDHGAAQAMQQKTSILTRYPVNVNHAKLANSSDIYRVQIGPIPDELTLIALKSELMSKGLPEPVRVLK